VVLLLVGVGRVVGVNGLWSMEMLLLMLLMLVLLLMLMVVLLLLVMKRRGRVVVILVVGHDGADVCHFLMMDGVCVYYKCVCVGMCVYDGDAWKHDDIMKTGRRGLPEQTRRREGCHRPVSPRKKMCRSLLCAVAWVMMNQIRYIIM
jgi:hypothetical protein